MTRTDDRRSAILDRLADHVLAEGLSASSLRPLARAARISDRMLLYYYKDKAEVVAATLEVLAQRMTALLGAHAAATPQPFEQLRVTLPFVLLDDRLWPFMRLWLEIAARAAQGDPVYRTLGETIARGFLAWGAAQLDSPTPEQRAVDAARLLVVAEGMVLLKSVGLEDVCRTAL